MRRVVVLLGLAAAVSVVMFGCASNRASSAGKTSVKTAAAKSAAVTATDTTATTSGGGNVKTIYLAGGCFWGLEKYVDQVHGVESSEVGYSNGRSEHATYRDGSGYAEVVKIDYDPAVAPLPFLLDLYYDAIDPTSVNRQGNDIGTDYRTGVYYTDTADREVIEQSLAELQKKYSKPIAIEVAPVKNYSAAEDYHQKYLDKNPGGYCHIPQKLFEAAAQARPK